MLQQLTIENIALIEKLDLAFESGLTILTGETGAGKSILIDALTLALGARADAGLIRTGCEQATITARFHLPENHPVLNWLKERELDGGSNELFLRRTLSQNGRNRAFINDTPIPVTTLAQLSTSLVDIHGQHDHQALLNPLTHLTILDAFAQHQDLVNQTAQCHQAWNALKRELNTLKNKAREAIERREWLEHHLEEIDHSGFVAGELEEIELQRNRLAYAVRLGETTLNALTFLSGEASKSSESGEALSWLISRAAGELEDGAQMDGSLAPLAEQLRSLQYELDDAEERIRHYAESLETDPEQLEAVEERLNLIRNLARKHRCSVEELLPKAQAWREELNTLANIDANEQQLQKKLATARALYQASEERLSHSRQQAALQLTQETKHHLDQLSMPGARFATILQRLTGDPRPNGMDEAEFQLSANLGEPLKPLKQVASGGEISRIMLALKTSLANAVTIPTLIFDEVDVGVGGRTAAAIGAKLAQIATIRQTFAVTHLPQVAARGNQHLKVTKSTHQGRVRITITPLEISMRIEEIARMLAGEEITTPARNNALELLRNAHPDQL